MIDEITRIACHESGHALVAWSLGWEIVKVKICREGEHRIEGELYANYCQPAPHDITNVNELTQEALYLLAGICAEAVLVSDMQQTRSAVDAGLGDIDLLTTIMRDYLEEETIGRAINHVLSALIPCFQEQSVRFIMEKLAAELLKQGQLSGEEVETLFGQNAFAAMSKRLFQECFHSCSKEFVKFPYLPM